MEVAVPLVRIKYMYTRMIRIDADTADRPAMGAGVLSINPQGSMSGALAGANASTAEAVPRGQAAPSVQRRYTTPLGASISRKKLFLMNANLHSILKELQLKDLLPLFESQGIDDAVLGELSDTDLKEIGIKKLGDRKKLLKAFGERSACPEKEKPAQIAITEAPCFTPQDQFTYDAQNGEIIITGFTGKGHVVVPDKFDDLDLPVRVIGAKAFMDNGMLLSVVLPEGITRIDRDDSEMNGAFRNCSSLTSITIPESVTSIGNNAFAICTGLTSITIPESVTSIGNNAFAICTGLTSITIPESVTSIGDYAFEGCRGLTSITIPESVTSIGDGAFFCCSSLISITIPESVNYIGSNIFSGCNRLQVPSIKKNIKRIKKYAFAYRTNITSITIPEGVTSIGACAFRECSSLTSITLPENLKVIGWSAFYGCEGLTSITIPEGVTSIGNHAFAACRGLTSITIPESVTSIGDYAFDCCRGLTSITIPESVTSIGGEAFRGCPLLTIHRPTKKQNIVAQEPQKGFFSKLFT